MQQGFGTEGFGEVDTDETLCLKVITRRLLEAGA